MSKLNKQAVFKQKCKNIYQLGLKELLGLWRDPLMLVLIIYSFTLGIYVASTARPDSVFNAAVAVVDEDHSQLSERITGAFFPPMFRPAKSIVRPQMDRALDQGTFTFVVVIPASFQKDLLAGRKPEIQLNVDATRMSQAFAGSGYIQQIVMQEVQNFVSEERAVAGPLLKVVTRNRYNANLTQAWFNSVMDLINKITMLAIILTGAALIREREHGTLEHLLVMPVTAFEIMASKIWSMGVVVLVASGLSVFVVIRAILQVPLQGDVWLFLLGVALHLFAVTSMGIFLATIAQNMPQLGMLLILVLIPMQMLSGGMTPQESMPEAVRYVMQLAPTTHFVEFSQAILYRGAGFDVVWQPFLYLFLIGGVLSFLTWRRFRRTVAA